MSLDNLPLYSGGCQCGAVRFHVEGALGDASICHCRMCQKASGNFYLPAGFCARRETVLDRGAPKKFQSSNFAFRGFCGDCGTPLFYEAPDGIALSIAAFDKPEEIAPTIQWGIEAKLPYVDGAGGFAGQGYRGRPRCRRLYGTASYPTSTPTTTPTNGPRRARP